MLPLALASAKARKPNCQALFGVVNYYSIYAIYAIVVSKPNQTKLNEMHQHIIVSARWSLIKSAKISTKLNSTQSANR